MKSIVDQIKFIDKRERYSKSEITMGSGVLYSNEKTKANYIRISCHYKSYKYVKVGSLNGKAVLFLNKVSGNKMHIEKNGKTIRNTSKGIANGLLSLLNVKPKGMIKKQISLSIVELTGDYAVLSVNISK